MHSGFVVSELVVGSGEQDNKLLFFYIWNYEVTSFILFSTCLIFMVWQKSVVIKGLFRELTKTLKNLEIECVL